MHSTSSFFQAEDGIRDFHVTGVQTCALPILLPSRKQQRYSTKLLFRARLITSKVLRKTLSADTLFLPVQDYVKIGRASCREREYIAVAAVEVKSRSPRTKCGQRTYDTGTSGW